MSSLNHYEVKGSGDAIEDAALNLAADILNVPAHGEFGGLPVFDNSEAIFPDGSSVNLIALVTHAIKANMAAAYLAGRSDQIYDSHRTNDKRTVRARDLKGIINTANTLRRDEDKMDVQNVLSLFTEERGSVSDPKLVAVIDQEIVPTIAEYIESGQLMFPEVDGQSAELVVLKAQNSDNDKEEQE